MMASLRHGVPYLVTCHGRDVLVDEASGYSVTKAPSLRALTRLVLERARFAVATSEAVRGAILGLAPRANVVSIPEGIGDDFLHDPAGDADRTIDLIFIGDLIRRKGVRTLVRAIACSQRLRSSRVVVVGTGPEEGQFRGLARECPTLDLQLLGAVVPEEIPSLLARSKVLAVPSHIEAFGIVALEGLAMGTTVVGSRTGSLGDLADDATLGAAIRVVTPGDAAALADALERSLGDVVDPGSRGAVQAAVRRRFSWRPIAREYIRCYTGRGPADARTAYPPVGPAPDG